MSKVHTIPIPRSKGKKKIDFQLSDTDTDAALMLAGRREIKKIGLA
jgi:hypothetical protein